MTILCLTFTFALFLLTPVLSATPDNSTVTAEVQADEAEGFCFVEPGRDTVIVLDEDAGFLAERAANLLQITVERSTGQPPKILHYDAALSKGFLAHAVELTRVGPKLDYVPERDTFTIEARRDWGRNIVGILSVTERGLHRGAVELLRRTAKAEWFPPRAHHRRSGAHNRIPQDLRMETSAYIQRQERLVWPQALNPLSHTDVFEDQSLLIDQQALHTSLIDWCLVTGFDTLVVDTRPESNPDSNENDRARRSNSLISYARKCSIGIIDLDSTDNPHRTAGETYCDYLQRLFPCWNVIPVFDDPQGIHARLRGKAEFSGIRRRIDHAIASGARGILVDARLIRNHEAPLAYLGSLCRNPHLDLKRFHISFCRTFFNQVSKSFLGWEAYWGGHYGYAYDCFRKAFDRAHSPIVQDRIRDMAMSSLFLDIEQKMLSVSETDEFLKRQRERIDHALRSMPDPLSSDTAKDIWLSEFNDLWKRIEREINPPRTPAQN